MPFATEEVISKLEENLKKISSVTSMLDEVKTSEQMLEIILEGLDMHILDTIPTAFVCNCSKERVEKALVSIGKQELSQMIDDGETIEVNCDFCNHQYYFTVEELKSRCEIMLENYIKTILIEARTMLDMARTQIAPAAESYAATLALNAERIKALDGSIKCRYETGLAAKLSALTDAIAEKTDALEKAVCEAGDPTDVIATSAYVRDTVLSAMEALRGVCDEAETVTAKSFWPFPTYAELLFGV